MDLIDRQALLKQIEIDSDGEPGYYGDTWKFIDTIKNLPSATDNNVGTEHGTNLAEVGTDCISRQAAIDALGELATFTEDWSCHTWMYTDDVYNAIKQLPPIQPEIIRCKDCKYWMPYDWMFSEVWRSKNMTDYPEDEIDCECSEMSMKANDFCSRGERRTE